MMKAIAAPGRRDRLIQERVHDPYMTRLKLPEPTVCPGCRAVFSKGRWRWTDALPPGADRELCQACHRIRNGFPAGTVTVRGSFLAEHREEVINLARHQEKLEKKDHPLHRIMGIVQRPDAVVIQTTDIHLPKRIGEMLQRAFKGGDLDVRYEPGTYFIRVDWRRDV